MPKCSVFSRLLQLPLTTFILYILGLITVIQFFVAHGEYNYRHTPREELYGELYAQVNPKLVPKKGKPNCKYEDILQSTKTINPWEVPKTFDDFSVKGLANGSYVPEDCNPLFSVAVLVTYRNRQSQLDVFLPYIHNFLRKQNIHYKIYLIEQQDEEPWNKGLLYNLGAKFAIADKFPCLILHDVDLLPLDEGNLYACMQQPRHLSASIDQFRYVLIYDWLVGGVLAVRSDQYQAANGFSNRFLQWGGEDDDFYGRLEAQGLQVERFPQPLSRYTALRHARAPRNPHVSRVLRESRGQALRDGLSTAVARSMTLKPHRLFTLIGVKL